MLGTRLAGPWVGTEGRDRDLLCVVAEVEVEGLVEGEGGVHAIQRDLNVDCQRL